jgi:hypothetical protein
VDSGARVGALLRAFALGSFEGFADGKFLEGRPLAAYPRAAKALEEGPWRHPDREQSDTLSRLFWWLLVYRTEAQRLLRVNSGWLEAGHPGILTALELVHRANAGVSKAIAGVDALLVEMISPEGKRIPESELVARWGFPDVDPDELERDEM